MHAVRVPVTPTDLALRQSSGAGQLVSSLRPKARSPCALANEKDVQQKFSYGSLNSIRSDGAGKDLEDVIKIAASDQSGESSPISLYLVTCSALGARHRSAAHMARAPLIRTRLARLCTSGHSTASSTALGCAPVLLPPPHRSAIPNQTRPVSGRSPASLVTYWFKCWLIRA